MSPGLVRISRTRSVTRRWAGLLALTLAGASLTMAAAPAQAALTAVGPIDPATHFPS